VISFPLAIVKRNFFFASNTIYFLKIPFKERNRRRVVVDVVVKKNVRIVVSFSFVVSTAAVFSSFTATLLFLF
jgi:hypothetical protein